MAVKGLVGLKHRTLPVFLLICLYPCWVESQVQDRVLAATNPNQRAILDGTVHPLARAQYDAGRADGSNHLAGITIYFALSTAQEAQLKALREEQQNPSSLLYHKWLTASEYGSRFGLTDGDIGKVTDWLQTQGFSIDGVSQTRTSIRFSGTIAQVENAFRTEIHRYNIDGESHIANATALSVPLALSGVILSVRNVTDFRPQPKHSSRRVKSEPSAHFTSSTSGNHYLAPDDFTTIYDVKALYNSGYDGSGEKIAVVGQTKISTSDIDAFRKASGLPSKNPTTVLVPGSGSSANISTGDEEESDLDLEWSGAIAKNATIYFVYTGNNRNYSVMDSLQYAIDHNTAPIISMSYGGCEAGWSQTDVSTVESWLQQANSQGQTVVVASGDSGAADCDYSGGSGSPITSATHGLAVDFPASSPYVTGIGGTEFNEGSGSYWNGTNNSSNGSAISYIPEGVWNDTSTSIANHGGFAAGGGGKSSLFAKPSWQTGTGVPSDGTRDVPDISLAASSYHDGYLFCTQGSCTNGFRDSQSYLAVAGGTSFGAPTFSGILALINQKLGSNGQANINPALYQAAISDYSNAFHDITTGNTFNSQNPGRFAAIPGYDLCTGWGSPVGLSTINALAGTGTNDFTFFIANDAMNIVRGGVATTTVTVTRMNGLGGNINLSMSGLPTGVAAVFSSPSTTNTSLLTLTVSNSATPSTLLRLATIANCRPTTAASMTKVEMIGCWMTTDAVAMPIKAPAMVGTIVKASSR